MFSTDTMYMLKYILMREICHTRHFVHGVGQDIGARLAGQAKLKVGEILEVNSTNLSYC